MKPTLAALICLLASHAFADRILQTGETTTTSGRERVTCVGRADDSLTRVYSCHCGYTAFGQRMDFGYVTIRATADDNINAKGLDQCKREKAENFSQETLMAASCRRID